MSNNPLSPILIHVARRRSSGRRARLARLIRRATNPALHVTGQLQEAIHLKRLRRRNEGEMAEAIRRYQSLDLQPWEGSLCEAIPSYKKTPHSSLTLAETYQRARQLFPAPHYEVYRSQGEKAQWLKPWDEKRGKEKRRVKHIVFCRTFRLYCS